MNSLEFEWLYKKSGTPDVRSLLIAYSITCEPLSFIYMNIFLGPPAKLLFN